MPDMKATPSSTTIWTTDRTRSHCLGRFTANSLDGAFGIRYTPEIGEEMIENLSDLKNYAEAIAKGVPSITGRVKINDTGLSADDLSRLSVLDLPPIYERCVSMFGLFGIAVGYFSMWPGSIKAGHMVEALLQSNTGSYPGAQEARNAGLLIVAQEEANLVCVARSNGNDPDAVYLLDVMRSPTVERQSVASNFEKFLLLAGNLHDIGRKYSGDAKEGIAKMVECCQYFGCTVEQTAFWVSRAEVVLS